MVYIIQDCHTNTYKMHGKLQKAMTDIFRIYHVNQIIDELKGLQE